MKTPFRVVAIAVLGVAPCALAATPPSGFTDTVVANASMPTAIGYEPGSQALFVLEKGSSGQARVLRKTPGSSETTALTLPCVDSDGERGLLGIAFDPDYLTGAGSRFVYLYYTRSAPSSGACAISGTSGSRNRIVRFLESGGTLSGEQLLLEGPKLNAATNHNAGTLRFAPDKTLFASMGDNATGGDANPLSRNLNDLRGKILRIKRDGSIPTDNPFVGQAGKRGEIWAWGLRNPFRFSIDAATGIPWIADVGESTWEEIDLGVAGANYGWPASEGPSGTSPGITAPLFAYKHSAAVPPGSGPGGFFTGQAIAGGAFYPDSGPFPGAYRGHYFFADFLSHFVARFDVANDAVYAFGTVSGQPVDMLVGADGALYVLMRDRIARFSAP